MSRKKKRIQVVGPCLLCHRQRVLRKSHFVPAALYKMILRQGGTEGNPMVVTREITIQTSRQFQEHLLCGECEHRFNKNGEDYTLAQVRNNRRFPLLDRLAVAMHIQKSPELTLYSGRAIGIDVDKLAYFAMSIFWRGSAHQWKSVRGHLHNPIGAYEEPLRRYLMGETAFPDHMVLVITACTDFESQSSVMSPAIVRGDKVDSFGFIARGIQFRLFTGADIPEQLRRVCCMKSGPRIVLVGNCRSISVRAFIELHRDRKP